MPLASSTTINILLADDDKDDRFFFAKALKEISLPTNLITVSDGARLIEYLSENLKNLPDVVFLDLNMPCKNGIECISEMKNNKDLKQIPVVIYSTSVRQEVADVLYGKEAHYYFQNCNFNELGQYIEQVLVMLKQNPLQPPRHSFIVNEKEF